MTQETHTPTPCANAPARQALDRAKVLVATRPDGPSTPGWAHEASHVGDLSVLALALVRGT